MRSRGGAAPGSVKARQTCQLEASTVGGNLPKEATSLDAASTALGATEPESIQEATQTMCKKERLSAGWQTAGTGLGFRTGRWQQGPQRPLERNCRDSVMDGQEADGWLTLGSPRLVAAVAAVDSRTQGSFLTEE